VYSKKIKENTVVQAKSKVPHTNTNSSSDEIKTDPITRNTGTNTASEYGLTSQDAHQHLKEVTTSPPSSPASALRNTTPQIVTVKEGNCILSLARKYYHMTSETIIDVILEANPGTNNIHFIKINQKLKIPTITEESLIIYSPDNTYKIYAGTFKTPHHAQTYFTEPKLKGKEINLIPREVSPRETWYRVELGKYTTKEACLKTIAILKQKGLLSSFGTISKTKENHISS
jgi:phage tail protein X